MPIRQVPSAVRTTRSSAARRRTRAPVRRPPRRRARRRTRRRVLLAVALVSAVAATIAWSQLYTGNKTVSSACTVAASGKQTFQLSPEQAQNAAIIAAVALKKGLPDHAVTIALATSLQETKLRNLTYGDLDSVGLFQQRPSQGWGPRAELLDPVYAASAFYDRLVQVSGWSTLAVTEAAQSVQLSAAPSAYARWESEARALAIALTGEQPAAFSCELPAFTGSVPSPTALTAAAANELGSPMLSVPLSLKAGWQVASWAVAHAWRYHIEKVSFGNWIWNAPTGRWASVPTNGSATAAVQVVYASPTAS